MSKEKCMYQDVADPTKACIFESREIMLGYHIAKYHLHIIKREETEANLKKMKRMESKPPKFL